MTDGTMLVNFERLHQAVADIDAAVNKLRTKLGDLDQAAKPLVDGWTGEAKNAYHAKQQNWTKTSEDLAQILQNIKGALQQSAEHYKQTEDKATHRFS